MKDLLTKAAWRKNKLSPLTTFLRGIAAGLFIALGGMAYTVVRTCYALSLSPLGPSAPERFLSGIAFSLGLILVVTTGAELFTGNVMVFTAGRYNPLKNWALVYAGNFLGALWAAYLIRFAGGGLYYDMIAQALVLGKLKTSFGVLLARGVLCNILVCLAVAMATKAETTLAKALVVIPPITTFIMLGAEHSVANMFLIPQGFLFGLEGNMAYALVLNLIPVTIGNIIGGAIVGEIMRRL